MDLYGLIWFIDETTLPDEQEFLSRYLRKPGNYPELAERVSKYCFRTLRSQATGYAKLPNRILITHEYTPSAKERELYNLLYAYINKPDKIAFPEMNQYDLALRLLSLQSSSTAAILQTIKGVIKRLESMPDAQEELSEWRQMQAVAECIKQDEKLKQLLVALKNGFALMKKSGAKKKAVIFTESVETQKMLCKLLSNQYKTCVYNGSTDYNAIQRFKADGEILISTDNGAKGFNLEDAAFVIHYDLLYNTLKMEQRIDRCHRLGQENDVLSLAFIDKNNFADVRKLELVNKRMLVADGVFGITYEVIGGFTENLDTAFETVSKRIRTKAQVEDDYQQVLVQNEARNKQLVSSAEDVLFTTFTKELADKITISPRYINEKAEQINTALWSIVKYFFEQYNKTHDDCTCVIDDDEKTITATNYEKLPMLFYYWTGSRNKPYQSLKSYGMAKDFKPHHGRITLTSIIGRGIIHELECFECGVLSVESEAYEPCEIGLYSINLSSAANRISADVPMLIGKTQSGKLLTEEQCQAILKLSVKNYSEEGRKNPHWLKCSSKPHELDRHVRVDDLIVRQSEKLSQSQAEEIDQMELKSKAKETFLTRDLDALDRQIKAVEAERETITNDRLKLLALDKKTNLLRQEYMKKQESQFFDAMRLDFELEEQIKQFTEKGKLTARVTREFILKVEGNNT